MKGLLAKPSLDSQDAREALLVVDYFDRLVESRASPPALLRAAAGLAECDVTWRRADGSEISSHSTNRRAAAPGVHRPDNVDPPSDLCADVGVDGATTLHRIGAARTLGGLLLERLVLSAATLSTRSGFDTREAQQSVMRLIDPQTDSVARRRAALHLGIDPDSGLLALTAQDLALQSPKGALRQWLHSQGAYGPQAVTARLGEYSTFLIQDRARTGTGTSRSGPPRVIGRARASSLDDAPVAVARSLIAYRFGFAGVHGPQTTLVDYDELGLLPRLLDPDRGELHAHPDVQLLTRVAAQSRNTSPTDLAVLDAVCRLDSNRLAAAELHIHHTTVAARLRHISHLTGWALGQTSARQRARLALLAYRLQLLEKGTPT